MNNLTVIYGPMFSGKTSYLLKKCNQAQNVLVFKPTTDKRSPKNKIKSHDGIEYSCIDVNSSEEILDHLNSSISMICIDELQFFSKEIVNTIKYLIAQGIEVIASGLLLDSKNNYFGSMKVLLALAKSKVELYSKCCICSNPASNTIRKNNSQKLIQLGGTETYTTYCTKCKQEKH